MVYRDRQGLSPSGDPTQMSYNRDQYLDNCFLLCINRDDDKDLPEIHRLQNNLMHDICNRSPSNQIKPQQQSKTYVPDVRTPIAENYDNDDIKKSSKDRDYFYRRQENQYDRDPHIITNRSKYHRDDDIDSYYPHDQYSKPARHNQRHDYNIMQHSDDELSVYEVSYL